MQAYMDFSSLKIMGIINLTPDSFSDGGKFNSIDSAVKQAKKLQKDGADIIDLGGESTGPGSKKVSLKEELKRVIPIVKALKKVIKIPISIDTYKAVVAERALKSGASIINDVTALRGDKKMAAVIAKYHCPLIIMYSKDSGAHASIKDQKYEDVMKMIQDFMTERIKFAKSQAIAEQQIIIDPGMGHFISSDINYSYEILLKLAQLKSLNRPILIGLSRKSLLGGSMKIRDELGKCPSAIAYLNGARIIRTHDVRGLKSFFKQVGIN